MATYGYRDRGESARLYHRTEWAGQDPVRARSYSINFGSRTRSSHLPSWITRETCRRRRVPRENCLNPTLAAILLCLESRSIPSVPFVRSPSLDPEQYALSVTDLISRFYSQLGSQQRLALREVLAEIMSDSQSATAFGFDLVGERLRQYYDENGRNEDGLTEVISRLKVLRLFEVVPSEQNNSPLMSGSLLVRLNELAADTLPAAFLLMNRLYDEMKRLPDAPRRGSVVQLRHVIFIDEAHHYLSQRSSPLARIIREGRSKGVAVLLATQTVSDLAGSAGADYREFISNSFFFKSNIVSNADIRAMVPTASHKINEVANVITGLGVGQMLYTRNLGRDPKSSVLNAVQYYRRT